MSIGFILDDGGRKAAGFVGDTGDCAVRAMAIALQLPYSQCYDELAAVYATSKIGSRGGRKRPTTGERTMRKGLHRPDFSRVLARHGWGWTACTHIGTGTQVHLDAAELPAGRIICRVSKHYCAVVDGVVHDTYLDDRDGKRAVYGYWKATT